jgi:HEAT repeat protein
MFDQVEIHKLVQSKDVEERKKAVEELKINFAIFNDKEETWDDLHRLTQDNNDNVRSSTAYAFVFCYSHIPVEYREQAWGDLHRLTQDKANNVRSGAAYTFKFCYPYIPEEYREQAWGDLHRLTQDNNDDV